MHFSSPWESDLGPLAPEYVSSLSATLEFAKVTLNIQSDATFVLSSVWSQEGVGLRGHRIQSRIPPQSLPAFTSRHCTLTITINNSSLFDMLDT